MYKAHLPSYDFLYVKTCISRFPLIAKY